MDILEVMKREEAYISDNKDMPHELGLKAKTLCFEYNNTNPSDIEKRKNILKNLLGTYNPLTFIEPTFRCDYGFNIHTYGLTVINYNVTILDTSPVYIGANAFIAPNVVLACAGHAYLASQRASGIGYSKPIWIGNDVWIGANSTVLGGVHIGNGSIIGANSLVNKDIPENVIACGNPCKVLRQITDKDKMEPIKF